VFSALVSKQTLALEPDSLSMTARPQILFLAEYDDNYNLVPEDAANYEPDGMIHLMPKFGFSKNTKNNFYGIGLDSDLRKGFYEAPFNANVNASGAVSLNFNNGLSIDFSDYFSLAEFDLGLTDLPNISDRQNNNLRSKISYNISPKLKIYASYGNRWNAYSDTLNDNQFERMSHLYGAGAAFHYTNRLKLDLDYLRTEDNFNQARVEDVRYINTVNTKLAFPISRSIDSYVRYDFENQESEVFEARNYADNRAVGGFSWTGRNRLKIWVEGGYQTIVFNNALNRTYEGIVGVAGFDLKITEVFHTKLSAGVDGYSNFVFDGLISYDYSDKTNISFVGSRRSQPLYFTNSPNVFFTAYNFNLNASTKIAEFMKLTAGGRMQTRDDFADDFSVPTIGNITNTSEAFLVLEMKPAEKFYIKLNGSYLLLKNDNKTVNIYEYDTWIAGVNASYRFMKWGEAGLRYQYATRIAADDRFDFNANRFGFFFKIII
jgi:hypothetical protein